MKIKIIIYKKRNKYKKFDLNINSKCVLFMFLGFSNVFNKQKIICDSIFKHSSKKNWIKKTAFYLKISKVKNIVEKIFTMY